MKRKNKQNQLREKLTRLIRNQNDENLPRNILVRGENQVDNSSYGNSIDNTPTIIAHYIAISCKYKEIAVLA
ncbi:hypothetical protein [Oceanobacillus sp. FSL W7-1304]|uniref:hypothetical protein n=1 Tax=Oceanobacillus sp. FSL W7-1304 TaxID=2975322 RepID=UPI0030DD4C05